MKTIQGVGTSIAGFVGPALAGPVSGTPEPLASTAEFERIYGSTEPIQFDSEAATPNYLAHAVRAYFANGGHKLYVSRLFRPSTAAHGARPTPADYERGLQALESVPDISVIAAPGYSAGAGKSAMAGDAAQQVMQALIAHCERLRYRFAVLDAADGQTVDEVRAYRARLDSPQAALYYPWVRITDPLTKKPLDVPPSGFLAGIYARHDATAGVHKPPANEPVIDAIGLEQLLTPAQQDVLNAEGINSLRSFEGRGYLVWGARTLSSDPEWKYINIRRYVAFLEQSIEAGTQWAVFEPNGEQLWDNMRRTVESFLLNEWRAGHLAGEKAEQAFFVRCDRTTMTQNDLDNGRLVCAVGVAPVRPAEFVIFHIGQWTASHKP